MVKNSPANAIDMGLIPESGRSPGEENGNLLQYSSLGNPMDREAWSSTDSGVSYSDRTEPLSTHMPYPVEKTGGFPRSVVWCPRSFCL